MKKTYSRCLAIAVQLVSSVVSAQQQNVLMFDSAYTYCPPLCKAQIATQLSLHSISSVYAAAFATAIVFGHKLTYDQNKLQEHLYQWSVPSETYNVHV